MDEEPKPKEAEVKDDKPAMDEAAVKVVVDAATAATRAQLMAVRTAEIEVHSIIGDLAVAMDSSEAVYKMALDAMKVDLTDVEPAAYRSVFRALKKQTGAAKPPSPVTIAQDSAQTGAKTFAEMFPNATKLTGA